MLIISFLSELKINFNKFFHKKELENHPLKQKNQEDYLLGFLEAPTRFELVIEVLQTFALPLGHGAILIVTPTGIEPVLPP